MKNLHFTLAFLFIFSVSYSQNILSCEGAEKEEGFTGKCIEYYPNDQVRKIGFYQNGKRVKKWITFHENGKKKEIETYNSIGQLHGKRKLYTSDGLLLHQDSYKNGKLHGKSKEYFLGGQIKKVTFYTDGKLDGYLKEWDMHGTLRKIEYYKHGKLLEVNVVR